MVNFIFLSDGVVVSFLIYVVNIWIYFFLCFSKYFKFVYKYNVDFVFYYIIYICYVFM